MHIETKISMPPSVANYIWKSANGTKAATETSVGQGKT